MSPFFLCCFISLDSNLVSLIEKDFTMISFLIRVRSWSFLLLLHLISTISCSRIFISFSDKGKSVPSNSERVVWDSLQSVFSARNISINIRFKFVRRESLNILANDFCQNLMIN
ncbi:unnamed protein product [Moneuplotes crassus]|uniref:Uncharacterized protein n=1 Tax=Euplotes crassus TaxID=5936 RepID=A0AAD1Y136_EUPCR|nr:unnamed protein product [Moneuplotes crassus]